MADNENFQMECLLVDITRLGGWLFDYSTNYSNTARGKRNQINDSNPRNKE